MIVDIEKFEIELARSGKSLKSLGIPKETVYRIRRGRNVLPRTVHKLAAALDCDVESIISRGGESNAED